MERARSCALTAGAVLAVAVAGLLAFGAGPAAAITGRVGPVEVSVSPTSGVTDGRTVSIRAAVPAGTTLYQIRAHLCRPGPDVRTDYDFGFQGQRCSNVAIGSGDVEKTVEYGSGVRSGELDSFRVGAGTARWVNELGYPQTLDCGPGRPCDLVVRLEITDEAVFFTAPLCYGAGCPAESAAPVTSPSTSPPPSSTTTLPPRSATRPASGAAAGRSGSSATTGARGSAPGSGGSVAGAGASAKGSSSPRAVGSGVPPQPAGSSGGLSVRARVLLSGAAGAVAGAWIVSVSLRGGGWIAFGVSALRRRSRRTRTV